MSNQVPPGPGPAGSEPPYGPYSSQAPGVPPVPPPPGPYQPGSYSSGGPTGAPPPSYGQGSYGASPSYGPEQPYGYSPEQPGYGAGGYQGGGQGAYPPGGYVPSYQGGPYPGAPKGGSGGKIVAIVAAAVVVVGLVVGGAVFLTRGRGDNKADSSTSAVSTRSHSPSPKPTRSTTGSTWSDSQAQAVAEAAAPGISAHDCFMSTSSTGLFIKADADIYCSNTAYGTVDIYVWGDTTASFRAVRQSFSGDDVQEVSWEHGTDFVYDASPVYYQIVRCYADAPVCIEAWEDTQSQSEATLNGVGTLDDAGIAALNSELAART